jgi:hypothetical protein
MITARVITTIYVERVGVYSRIEEKVERSPGVFMVGSTHHIFGEPGPAVGGDVDADADLVQGGAEQVDAVPTGYRLVSHAFLNAVDASPGCRIWSRQADTLCAVAITGVAFIGDALEGSTAVRTGVVKAAVIHIPAVEKCAIGEGCVPGEWGQAAGGPLAIDQLEKLLGKLLGL